MEDEIEHETYQDPETLKDKLPQPYRMLDKMVNYVFNKAWIIIESLDKTKELDRIAPKYPLYGISDTIEMFNNVNYVESKSELNLALLGLTNGLAAVNLSSPQQILDTVVNDSLDIIKIKLFSIELNCLIFVTLDRKGGLRIYSLLMNKLYLIYKHAESSVITQFKLSTFGEYIGFAVDSQEERDKNVTLIEVYSVPKEAWLLELNMMKTKVDGEEIKFSQLIFKSKIMKPKDCMGGPAIHITSKKYEDLESLSKIGLGTEHCVTSEQIAGRCQMFSVVHDRHIRLVNQGNIYARKNNIKLSIIEENDTIGGPKFFFMTPSEYSNNSSQDESSVIAVVWPGYKFILYYDITDSTPQSIKNVWPTANTITQMTCSSCGTYLAFTTSNNTLTVWNKKYGLPYHFIPFSHSIVKLHILDNYIGRQLTDNQLTDKKLTTNQLENNKLTTDQFANDNLIPDQLRCNKFTADQLTNEFLTNRSLNNDKLTKSMPYNVVDTNLPTDSCINNNYTSSCNNVCVLVQCSDGNVFVVIMDNQGLVCPPISVYSRSIGCESASFKLKFIIGLPTLVLIIIPEGPILVHSLVDKRTLCQLAVPQYHKLKSCKIAACGGEQISLLVVFNQIENLTNSHPEQKVFIYNIWTYPELNEVKVMPYQEVKINLTLISTVANRYFRKHILSKNQRDVGLKECWEKLNKIDFKKDIEAY